MEWMRLSFVQRKMEFYAEAIFMSTEFRGIPDWVVENVI
jgi:hypothetical protein